MGAIDILSDAHQNKVVIFDKPILSIDEVAILLNKSVTTLRRYVRNNEIPYRKKIGTTYFLREELMEWIEQGD